MNFDLESNIPKGHRKGTQKRDTGDRKETWDTEKRHGRHGRHGRQEKRNARANSYMSNPSSRYDP